MTNQANGKSNAGYILMGVGIVVEIGAIIMLIFNIRQGSPPIAAAIGLLVVGTMLLSIGTISQAKKKL